MPNGVNFCLIITCQKGISYSSTFDLGNASLLLWRSWLPARGSKGVFSEIDALTAFDAELEDEGPGDDGEAWSPDINPAVMMDTDPLKKI